VAKWTLEFDEYGGYDCMTGAWEIRKDSHLVLQIDQRFFGQSSRRDDHDHRSDEAKRVAEVCCEALMRDELYRRRRAAVTDEDREAERNGGSR
jgi:hypothetical protein